MKSEAVAFGVAGILFGLIAGWIMGSQDEAGRRQPLTASPAAAAAGARSRRVAGPAARRGQGDGVPERRRT